MSSELVPTITILVVAAIVVWILVVKNEGKGVFITIGIALYFIIGWWLIPEEYAKVYSAAPFIAYFAIALYIQFKD